MGAIGDAQSTHGLDAITSGENGLDSPGKLGISNTAACECALCGLALDCPSTSIAMPTDGLVVAAESTGDFGDPETVEDEPLSGILDLLIAQAARLVGRDFHGR